MLENTGQDEFKIQTLQTLNTTQKKETTQNNKWAKKQNNPGLVAFHDTRPGNEVGLFYNAPEYTWGRTDVIGLCSVLRPHQHSIGYRLID